MKIADGMSRLPEALREEARVVEHRIGIEVSVNTIQRDNSRTTRDEPAPAREILPGGGPTQVASGTRHQLQKWLNSSWYAEIVAYLLEGRQSLEESRRRLITRRALRYRIVGHTLYYMENDESLAECLVNEDVLTTLQTNYNACGHFAALISMKKLRGKSFWPTRSGDVENYC
ncbi:hypothetical protein EDB80DRAFT_133685 [Ilyonectria destructans]|nr:hypothetical protein EDB80DRAFT_133685 [Ilyonectria destructans]